jgi:hypothetical protein
VSNDFNLDGVEVSIIKALGFGAGDMSGKALAQRVPELSEYELVQAVQTLVSMGYVTADKSFGAAEDFRATSFQINSGYQRELKESLAPRSTDKSKNRRIRRD